jgi:crossover junction endodeoxyribonuclease RuvC
MRILALDLATKTGWAYGKAGSRPKYGVERLKKPTDDVTRACRTLGRLIVRFCRDEDFRPALIVYEAPLTPFAGHADQRQRSIESVIMPQQLVGAVESNAEHWGVPCRPVHAGSVRKHFCGRANFGDRSATKKAVIERCHALRLLPADVKDDNIADAVACWSYACTKFAGHREEALLMFGEKA